ncbi:hypothetical protein TTE2676 [Caldanaerobacter subterraneus subsp. tengcongensis MB4]|uniref:Uncharacterized protein n=1 Tax=Caldanaerobacter subterraneus subsp. tengcongensis (strain DSM 15242 / JCM 11007 / NBRC 100824 / MB4) TaxID=273068 RepID=Q8R6V8_CALS4|nr:hypothetical protein TTE2676 [Caldanaerobacter subterraneus subsp. tengcongensis MB4]
MRFSFTSINYVPPSLFSISISCFLLSFKRHKYTFSAEGGQRRNFEEEKVLV